MEWISGWKHRIKFEIDHVNIGENLYNFPILINLDTTYSGVFIELGNNNKRIAFINPNSGQQYFCEIENWDSINNSAQLWVKIPTVSSGINTEFYMLYDNSHVDNSSMVGDTNSVPAQQVWDSNFKAVYHMSQDPSTGGACILDSTSNANHGTPYGNMTSDDLVEGPVGKALDFDGVDDCIGIVNTGQFSFSGLPFSISLWIKANLWGYDDTLIDFEDSGWRGFLIRVHLDYLGGNHDVQISNGLPSTGIWTHIVFTSNGTDGNMYFNGSLNKTVSSLLYPNNSTSTYGIGNNATNTTQGFNGIIGQVQINNVIRSEAWIKATYYSNIDNLLIKSSEETLTFGKLNYANRIKLIISSDKIDTVLYNFPILINLSESSGVTNKNLSGIFTQLESDSNRKKIAVTDYTGIAQCYVEIENWSTVNKSAQLWVKVPEVSSTQDTVLYLYYDINHIDNSLMVGDTNSVPAQQVWDNNFVTVYHMAQDPSGGGNCILDSTINSQNAYTTGSMTTSDLVDGGIGKAINFNGINQNAIFNSYLGLNHNQTTFEGFIKPTSDSPSVSRLIRVNDYGILSWRQDSYGVEFRTKGYNVTDSATPSIYVGEYHYFAATAIHTGDAKMIIDGAVKATIPYCDLSNNFTSLTIAGAGSNEYNAGEYSEIRISNTARSESWIKATYYSNIDSILTFSNPYYFSGYVYERGIPVSRQVYAYYKASGKLISSTISDDNGYYYLETTYSGAHFLVCTDDLYGVDYNDLIIGNVFPTEIFV